MEAVAEDTLSQIIGVSPEIARLRAFIPKVARSDCNVLITGETGTGKERVAHAIHASSRRAQRNLVAINCAALPDTLLEGELFGYEKGAFTGAHQRFEGRLKQADGGTLFLDEVGDMTLPSQAKILRAIEQQQFYRVGSRTPESVNVRVIAATNRNLPELVSTRDFRRDLYYRLNVVGIELPPLRERRTDIPLLFERYLQEYRARYGEETPRPTPEAFELLMQYDWPGNVRELKNVVERILIDSPAAISPGMLPAYLGIRATEAQETPSDRDRLLKALLDTNWNRTRAAQTLSWSRMTLYRKMKKFHLQPPPGSG
jgi:transcriptional regulator with GAF, ATPase, and Fis domain